jgi:RNA polymerase sigma-70 factor (ECF subfamily)
MPESDVSSAATASSWLRRLPERDPEAWQQFLRLYGPLVYSWCRARWHLSPVDAADILQDVAARVLEVIGDFRGGNFVAWLEKITRSRVANFCRKNPTRAPGGSDAQHLLAEIVDHRAECRQAGSDSSLLAEPSIDNLGGVLGRAVEAVRQRCAAASWQAFWQVAVQGRKPADVAGDLGLSANAVYIAVSRILHRVRAEAAALDKGPDL